MEIGHASPMDTGNPALGAASGAAQAASSAGYAASENYAAGLRFAQALRSAAQQQAQQQHQDRLRAFDEEMRIRNAGGTPYLEEQAPVNTGVVPGKGLIPRDQSAAAKKAAPQNVISDSFGRRWVLPDKAATNQDNKSFTESREAAAGGALPVSGGQVRNPNDNTPRFSADESGNLTPQGFGLNVPVSDLSGTLLKAAGGQQFYQPTPDEKANVGLRADLAKKAAEQGVKPSRLRVDTEHFSVPGMIDEDTGKFKPIELPAGVTHKDAAPKPEKDSTHQHWIDVASDPKASPEDKKRAKSALDLEDSYKRRGETAQRAEEKQQKVLDGLTKQHDALYEKEQQLHGYRLEWGQNVSTADDETVVDPETKREVTMNAARRQYYKTKIDTAQNEIAGLQQRRQKVIERATRLSGGIPERPANANTAAQPAAPAGPPQSASVNQTQPQQSPKPGAKPQQQPAQQQAKVTGLSDVRAYAKEKGIDEAAAVRKFKAAGYAIQ